MAVTRLGPGGSPRGSLSSVAIKFASISGTFTGTINEVQVRDASLTLIITLTNDTWVASGAAFDDIRQDIIDGLVSDGSDPSGWNAVIQAGLVGSNVVRTSDTVVTITAPESLNDGYDIDSNETVTVTVPASALAGGEALVAIPTFTITRVVVSTGIPEGTFGDYAPRNTDAIQVASNYEICDRTGFKMRRGTLKKEWNGLMVRPESWERRNPQDFVRVPPEREKGSPRPEQADQFVDDDVYPNGVGASDL